MVFLELFPKKGDHTTQLLFEALSKRLITDEERDDIYQIRNVFACSACGKEYGFSRKEDAFSQCKVKGCKGTLKPTGGMIWRTKDDQGNDIPMSRDITIGEMANHQITKALKELSEAEALELTHKTLYNKIVLGRDAELSDEEIDEIILKPLPKERAK